MRGDRYEPVPPPVTPAEARRRYRKRDDATRDEWYELWHSQPHCWCGDLLAQHRDEPPHRCAFGDCHCCGFRDRSDLLIDQEGGQQ